MDVISERAGFCSRPYFCDIVMTHFKRLRRVIARDRMMMSEPSLLFAFATRAQHTHFVRPPSAVVAYPPEL